MALLSKDQILKSKDTRSVEVDVPEWGGKVRLMSMTAASRDWFDNMLVNAEGGNVKNIRSSYVAMCLVDAKGELMFDAEEIEALSKKSAAALDRLFEKAQEINMASKDSVEEAEKN